MTFRPLQEEYYDDPGRFGVHPADCEPNLLTSGRSEDELLHPSRHRVPVAKEFRRIVDSSDPSRVEKNPHEISVYA